MSIFGADLLPDTSGRNLGAQDARWDAKLRNLDVSGAITGNFTGLAIFKMVPLAVPWSATPLFDGGNKPTGFKMILTGDVAAVAFQNIPDGAFFAMVLIQDAIGGHAFPWPSNVRGGMPIGTAPNEESSQIFWNDGVIIHAVTTGVIS